MITSINLLLFSVQNIIFGVHADQVEELLKAESCSVAEKDSCEYTISYKNQELRVLNFSEKLQLDKRPKSEHNMATSQEDNSESFMFSDPLTFPSSIHTTSPKILVIKHQHEGYIGFHIKGLRKLITISLDQIHALPFIMQRKKQIQGLWGIALLDEGLVILINLEQLCEQSSEN